MSGLSPFSGISKGLGISPTSGIGGGGLSAEPSASFLLDLQNSAIPQKAAGSPTPTFTRATMKYVLGYAASAVVTDDPIWIQCASGEIGFTGARRVFEGVWSSYDVNGVFLSTTLGASASCCDDLGPIGYDYEIARTNSALHSRKLAAGVTATAWVESNITAADDATGIDGVANACSTLTATANNGTILQAITLASAAAIFQPFVKRKTGTGTIEITLNGGTNWTDITAAVDAAAPDWYSLAAVTATLANPSIGYRLGTSGDEIEVDMNDCQNGTFRTSPIPTTTATATRNEDVLTYPTAGNINTAQGSFYVESTQKQVGDGAILLYTAHGTQMPRITSLIAAQIGDGTNTVAKTGLNSLIDGVPHAFAGSWGGSSMSVTADGEAVASGTFDGSMIGSESALRIGFVAPANIRFVRIYPQALSSAQLEALTA